MRRLLLLLLLANLGISKALPQNSGERRIYLWDVTLSMKGYKGVTPDIYNDVVKFLEQEINSIKDGNTEIIVLPFQESILDQWKTVANKQGKEEIINKIKNYSNNKVTNTNIVKPINDVKASFVKPDKKNVLYILTDGKQSGGSSDLVKTIKEWGDDAKKLNAYALYVMLTRASEDQDVIKVIQTTDHIDVVKETIYLQPERNVVYNIKNDRGKQVDVELKCRESFQIPDNLKIKVTAEGEPDIIEDQEVFVKDNKISLKINQSEASSLLTNSLKSSLVVKFEIMNRDEILQQNKRLVLLNPDRTVLELIRNPEKKLTIRYE
jgi:hypothetical protein